MEDLKLPAFDYYLDESDPDIVILRRQDDSFVAAFSASGATREGIIKVAKEDYRELLRACLVSDRVGLGGAKSALFIRGTTSREPFLRASFFSFRSVPTKESPQAGPPRTPENAK